jgi:succinate-semialdehyde dehydrogenase/glutarate-semialdehyde dehydrogenase
MNPPVAARASQTSAPTLRGRLKDPSLLREQCYIDGTWVGQPEFPVNNPATGIELAKIAQLGAADATRAVEARARFPGLGEAYGQAALQHLA